MGDAMRGRRLVLLAMGVDGEPRAAWYEAVHEADLVAAARQGGQRLVEVSAAALQGLDLDIAAGQLLGPGLTSALPLVRRTTFDALVALPPLLAVSPAGAQPSPPAAVRVPQSLRTAKRTVKPGTVVLASITADDGWWEAEVVAIMPGKELRLRWRDFPGMDDFSRPLTHVAVPPVGSLR